MTTFTIQALIVLLVLLLFSIFASWIDKFNGKHKEEYIEKVIDKVSSVISSNVERVMEQYKTGLWYLAVYTEESSYPLWISNNNIRSVHPDPKNRKLIIKQFNGEDMVIENVVKYVMRAANKMGDYYM